MGDPKAGDANPGLEGESSTCPHTCPCGGAPVSICSPSPDRSSHAAPHTPGFPALGLLRSLPSLPPRTPNWEISQEEKLGRARDGAVPVTFCYRCVCNNPLFCVPQEPHLPPPIQLLPLHCFPIQADISHITDNQLSSDTHFSRVFSTHALLTCKQPSYEHFEPRHGSLERAHPALMAACKHAEIP